MRYLIRRLVLFVAALFGLSLLVFVALRILPGDVASVMAGTNATPARVAPGASGCAAPTPLPQIANDLADAKTTCLELVGRPRCEVWPGEVSRLRSRHERWALAGHCPCNPR